MNGILWWFWSKKNSRVSLPRYVDVQNISLFCGHLHDLAITCEITIWRNQNFHVDYNVHKPGRRIDIIHQTTSILRSINKIFCKMAVIRPYTGVIVLALQPLKVIHRARKLQSDGINRWSFVKKLINFPYSQAFLIVTGQWGFISLPVHAFISCLANCSSSSWQSSPYHQ